MAFSKLNSTSSGVSVVPSPSTGGSAILPWNFTPSRRTKVATVVLASQATLTQFGFDPEGTPLLMVNDWARSPPMLPSGS